MVLRNLRNCRGVAAVEFALLAPVLFLLLFVIVEGALLYYNYQVITNASREGTRVGIIAIDPVPGGIETVINNYCNQRLITFGDQNPPTITTNSYGDNYLRVEVDYQYDFLVLPGFLNNLTGPITLRTQTVMRME